MRILRNLLESVVAAILVLPGVAASYLPENWGDRR